MEESTIQAKFQLMDNYISEFSLNVNNKIVQNQDLDVNFNVGFRIVNIDKKELVGQVELRYDMDIIKDGDNVAKIILAMNALFKGDEGIDEKTFEQMLKINGATTLSHLCRAYISSATALSGMPTITIPLIDFNEFFQVATEESMEEN